MTSPVEPSKNYEVFDEDAEFRIKEISEYINAKIPAGNAIIVLMAKPGEAENVSFFFMSNLDRLEMLRLIQAYLESEDAKDKSKGEV